MLAFFVSVSFFSFSLFRQLVSSFKSRLTSLSMLCLSSRRILLVLLVSFCLRCLVLSHSSCLILSHSSRSCLIFCSKFYHWPVVSRIPHNRSVICFMHCLVVVSSLHFLHAFFCADKICVSSYPVYNKSCLSPLAPIAGVLCICLACNPCIRCVSER